MLRPKPGRCRGARSRSSSRCRVASGRSPARCRNALGRNPQRLGRCFGPRPAACRVDRGRSPSPCRPEIPRSKLPFVSFSVCSAAEAASRAEGHLKVSLLNVPSLHNSFDSGAVLPRRESPLRYLPVASNRKTASVQGLLPPSSLPQPADGRSHPDFRFRAPMPLCFPRSWSLSRLPSKLATDFGALLHSKIRCLSFGVSRTGTRSPLRIARRGPTSLAEASLANEF